LSLAAFPAVAQQPSQRGGGREGQADPRAFGREPRVPEGLADEVEQAYRKLDEKALAAIPPRDFKVKTETAPLKTKLYRADPKLLENKFVATFNVLPAGLDLTDPASVQKFGKQQEADSNLIRSYPDDLRELIAWEGTYLFLTDRGFPAKHSLGEQFKLLAANCPPNERPDQELVEFLTSVTNANRHVIRGHMPPGEIAIPRGSRSALTEVPGWSFTLLAPTAEAAQQRAAAILRLLDGGMSRPMQRYALKQGRESLAAARLSQGQIADHAEQIRQVEEAVAKPSEISADILSQLKAQKVMVAVELAGLIARVKACDEMLKDPKRLEIATLQSITDMKVKAEIERVGIKEKLDQINAFITEGDLRESAKSNLASLQASRRRSTSTLSDHLTNAQWYAALVELYAPLQLAGNQITISPLEWTN
jgi:hypothetical protein